jgi:hypothetical protein
MFVGQSAKRYRKVGYGRKFFVRTAAWLAKSAIYTTSRPWARESGFKFKLFVIF